MGCRLLPADTQSQLRQPSSTAPSLTVFFLLHSIWSTHELAHPTLPCSFLSTLPKLLLSAMVFLLSHPSPWPTWDTTNILDHVVAWAQLGPCRDCNEHHAGMRPARGCILTCHTYSCSMSYTFNLITELPVIAVLPSRSCTLLLHHNVSYVIPRYVSVRPHGSCALAKPPRIHSRGCRPLLL